ncbi:unnamed protein product [Mytilus edulis]|uniref:Uncharacterized protein n=1 Tax=Mytilus edulis TaxID=6550 RepID=A0A8S3V4V2_MYTED|nr:unnamed protein product [Mytilus edulis]
MPDPLTSGVVAVAAGVTATVAAPLVLSAAGFGAAGVAAGTVAAWIQTPITAAGGWFAVCQSAGVLGMAASTKVAIGATVGTTRFGLWPPIGVFVTCKLHNEKYELFCAKHDCPCCKKCVKSHNDCKGLTDINELIKNVKTSNAFNEIEQTLQEVVENIKRLSTNRNENLKSIENKKREIEAEIKQTRIQVNHHLDKLQDDLIKELMTVEQREKSKIEKLLTSLKKKEKEMTEVQENFATFKQHASELQTFLTMKNIEKDIVDSVQKFGEINVCSDPCDFSIHKRKDRQAQIMVALPTRDIDNLTLTLQKRIKTNMSLSLAVHCFLIVGWYSPLIVNKITVFKSDGSKDFEIKNIGRTFDVVFIGDDSIAVTSGDSNQINIIDLKKKSKTKSIKVDSYNGGVAYKDGYLIYCAREKGIQMISLNDETITNVNNTKLSGLAYVTTFGDKLFYTNCNDSVTCCDYHGHILWTFCDKSVVRSPQGVSVDNDGNVYVVGGYTNNVVVISADGQHYRQLLSSEDGLSFPWALHYDTSTNELLVANQSNEAFLYDVK